MISHDRMDHVIDLTVDHMISCICQVSQCSLSISREARVSRTNHCKQTGKLL